MTVGGGGAAATVTTVAGGGTGAAARTVMVVTVRESMPPAQVAPWGQQPMRPLEFGGVAQVVEAGQHLWGVSRWGG